MASPPTYRHSAYINVVHYVNQIVVMNIDEIKLNNFDMSFSLVASLLLFAAVLKFNGDAAALLFTTDGNYEGLEEFEPYFRTILVSWLLSTAILMWALPKLFKLRELRISIRIGIMTASVIIAAVVWLTGFEYLIGGHAFDLKEDYTDIIRNLIMGMVVVAVLKWREIQTQRTT